jgi:hypothetical protein
MLCYDQKLLFETEDDIELYASQVLESVLIENMVKGHKAWLYNALALRILSLKEKKEKKIMMNRTRYCGRLCTSKKETCRRKIRFEENGCSFHRLDGRFEVRGLDDEEQISPLSDAVEVVLKVGSVDFITTVGVLRMSQAPFFEAIANNIGDVDPTIGHHEFTFEHVDSKYFQDFIFFLQDRILPLKSRNLLKLQGLRKILDRFSIRLAPIDYVYVIGGYKVPHGVPSSSYDGVLSDVLMYDPSSDTWISMAPMRTKRQLFGTCCVGTNIYVIGGQSTLKGRRSPINLVEKYDILTNTWTEMAPMLHPRINHSVACVGTKIYVMGGGDIIERGNSAFIEVYNTVDDTWTHLEESMPEKTAIATTCVVGKDIYLFGGKNSYRNDSGMVHKFNTMDRTWTVVQNFRFVMDSNPNGGNRMIGCAHVVGDVIYLIAPDGNAVLFDPKDETVVPIESHGPRVGGRTFSKDGCIYDVDWNYNDDKTHTDAAKGTIDGGDNITWTRIKNIPGSRERFGGCGASMDILDAAILRLMRQE